MQRLKTAGAAGNGFKSKVALLATLVTVSAGALRANAQNGKIGPEASATYDNKYEVYGGINYMNFQAGQNLPNRMNLAGGELMATYWITNRLGAAVDYRGEAGTTPTFPSPGSVRPERQLVYMNMGMLGVQYRGPKGHFAAVDYHALIGASDGVFNGPSNYDVGLYSNRTKPIAALGISLDYNRSKNLAIRLQPDLILEHFGSETREFFAISGGVIYRFGKR
jgi:hypothetical protein